MDSPDNLEEKLRELISSLKKDMTKKFIRIGIISAGVLIMGEAIWYFTNNFGTPIETPMPQIVFVSPSYETAIPSQTYTLQPTFTNTPSIIPTDTIIPTLIPATIAATDLPIIPTEIPPTITPQMIEIPTSTNAIQSNQGTGIRFLWDKQATHLEETVDLNPGEILFLSAGNYRVDNLDCSYVGNWVNNKLYQQICIYLRQATVKETITIKNLTKGHAWIGIYQADDPMKVLDDRIPYFWISPNCGEGCQYARVYIDRENGIVDKFIMYPNGTVKNLP
jgi:hypothetical protein